VEKSLVTKENKGTNAKENVFSLQLNMRFTQTCNVWKFARFKIFVLSQLLKPFFVPEPL